METKIPRACPIREIYLGPIPYSLEIPFFELVQKPDETALLENRMEWQEAMEDFRVNPFGLLPLMMSDRVGISHTRHCMIIT